MFALWMQVFSSPKSVPKDSFTVPDPAGHLFLAEAFESFTNTKVFCASNASQLLFSDCFCSFPVCECLWWQCKAAIFSLSTHSIKAVREMIAGAIWGKSPKIKIHPILSLGRLCNETAAARNNICFITSSQWHVASSRSVRFEQQSTAWVLMRLWTTGAHELYLPSWCEHQRWDGGQSFCLNPTVRQRDDRTRPEADSH